MPSIDSPFRISDAAQAWYDAMAAQDTHEQFDCEACRLVGAPVCAEGRRLQLVARAAHGAWISDQYAGKAVA